MKGKKLVIDNGKLLEEWHWEKNNSLNIFLNKLTCGSDKNVWWICNKCGHEWETTVYVRTSMNCRCPECSKKVISRKVRNKTTNVSYNSMKEAGEAANIHPFPISMRCRGIIPHAGHYEWEYVED